MRFLIVLVVFSQRLKQTCFLFPGSSYSGTINSGEMWVHEYWQKQINLFRSVNSYNTLIALLIVFLHQFIVLFYILPGVMTFLLTMLIVIIYFWLLAVVWCQNCHCHALMTVVMTIWIWASEVWIYCSFAVSLQLIYKSYKSLNDDDI